MGFESYDTIRMSIHTHNMLSLAYKALCEHPSKRNNNKKVTETKKKRKKKQSLTMKRLMQNAANTSNI